MKLFIETILPATIILNVFSAFAIAYINGFDLSVFNPIRNYKSWKFLNWFGIIIITFLLNILLWVLAVIYWIYKSFTIGRINNEEE